MKMTEQVNFGTTEECIANLVESVANRMQAYMHAFAFVLDFPFDHNNLLIFLPPLTVHIYIMRLPFCCHSSMV